MELRHLHYFQVLAEELHFGRAAERLCIAQPPLSRQIKQLEEELSVRLFDRNKRKVVLTNSGAYLKREADRLLQQVQQMRENVQLIEQGLVGQLSVGYVGAAMHCILPDILCMLQECFPDITTNLLELSNEEQIRSIQSGRIDVGFVRTPIRIEGVVAKTVFLEKFVLVLPEQYSLTTEQSPDLADLANAPFISFARDCGPGLVDTIVKICNKAGFAPRIVHETSQINSILRLVESGLGYSIVPVSAKYGYQLRVRYIELNQYEETAALSLIYKKDTTRAIVKNFLSLFDDRKFSPIK